MPKKDTNGKWNPSKEIKFVDYNLNCSFVCGAQRGAQMIADSAVAAFFSDDRTESKQTLIFPALRFLKMYDLSPKNILTTFGKFSALSSY